MQRVKIFALNFVSLLLLGSCGSLEVPDFKAHTIDPYTDECYGISVLSNKEEVLPKAACYRGVILFSEDYAMIKKAFYKNCLEAEKSPFGKTLSAQCRQSVEVLDNIFVTLDKAFAEVYGVKK